MQLWHDGQFIQHTSTEISETHIYAFVDDAGSNEKVRNEIGLIVVEILNDLSKMVVDVRKLPPRYRFASTKETVHHENSIISRSILPLKLTPRVY